MHQFKVLTLNIHKGFSMGNRRFTLEKIRECLRDTESNIVFLQEVSGENALHRKNIDRWPESNQFEYLADSVWDHYAYGKNAITQHGHHGNVILSEVPFARWDNIDISILNFSQRGILHGLLTNRIHLLCLHFGLFELERRFQLNRLIHYVKTSIPDTAPLILAGDFNDWRKIGHRRLVDEIGLHEAYEQTRDKLPATFPALFPCLPMDRIYFRGFTVKHTEIMTGASWRPLSDHCAMIAELHLHR